MANLDPNFIKSLLTSESFPDTEAVYVTWIGGTSGASLATIMAYCLYDDKPYSTMPDRIKLSKFNDSHAGLVAPLINGKHYLNWSEIDLPGGHFDNMPPIGLLVKPDNPNIPVLLHGHHSLNRSELDKFFKRWPKGKICVVTFYTTDLEIKLNSILKIWSGIGKLIPENWANMKKSIPALKDVNLPEDITPFQMASALTNFSMDILMEGQDSSQHINYDILSDVIKKKFTNIYKAAPTAWFNPEENKISNNYKDKILHVPYYTLVREPDKLFDMLSKFLNMPIPEKAKEQHLRYIKNQKNLVNMFAPWLRMPGPWATIPNN